jgi:hypothetical protein
MLMIYGAGVAGFIIGFIFGQMVLYFLLRNKTNQELLKDRYLKMKYGTINWACAGLGVYGFIKMYRLYFPL